MGAPTLAQLLADNNGGVVLGRRDAATCAQFREVLTEAHRRAATIKLMSGKQEEGLGEVYTAARFAYDQVWEQVDVENGRVLPAARRALSVVMSRAAANKKKIEKQGKRQVRFADEGKEKEGKSKKKKKKKKKKEDSMNIGKVDEEEQFFDEDAMNDFADDGEDVGISAADMGSLYNEQEEEEEEEEDKGNDQYEDFFDAPRPSSRRETVDMEEEEETEFGRETRERQAQIQALELENVESRAWALRGEVSGHSRPRDSLVDTEETMGMTHDMTGRVKTSGKSPGQVNETIEDIIRQRVIDGIFDNVQRVLQEEYKQGGKMNKDTLPEVCQEKANEGLGEVYAREFMHKKESDRNGNGNGQGVGGVVKRKEGRVEETIEQKEVNGLFDKVSKKLATLCQIHFVSVHSDEAMEEMKVSGKSVKAVSNEQVGNLEQGSDAALLAPKEVFATDATHIESKAKIKKKKKRKTQARKQNQHPSSVNHIVKKVRTV